MPPDEAIPAAAGRATVVRIGHEHVILDASRGRRGDQGWDELLLWSVADVREKAAAVQGIWSFLDHVMLLRSTFKYSPPKINSECPIVEIFQRPQSKAGLPCENGKRDALQMLPMFYRSPALQVPSNSRQDGGCGEPRWSPYPHKDKVRWSGRMLALCKWIISPQRMGVGLILSMSGMTSCTSRSSGTANCWMG